MQKKIKVIFILVIGLMVMIYAGNILYEYFAYTPSERYFYKELKRRIKKGEKEIYLKDLTDFEWDEGYCLPPYSLSMHDSNGTILPDSKERKLKYYKNKLPNISNDPCFAFLFLFKKSEIRIIKSSRRKIHDIRKVCNLYKSHFDLNLKLETTNKK